MSEIKVEAASVRLQNVTKNYPGMSRPAIDDVSLEIRAGEFMTFLGPSGSGKSTVLAMIAGFTGNSGGGVYIADELVTNLPAHKRNLGMVFQNYALFPHLTVAQNIEFPLQERRMSRSERRERVQEALEMVRLEEFASRKPKQLSGGQQQRVALARALVFRPRLLLLDEPLGALDKRLREEMQNEIARIHTEFGLTCVFVTHDQEEALALSDRIAVFSRGKIEQVGTGEELYERPASLFVAHFLGDSKIFRGRLTSDGGVETPKYGVLRGARTTDDWTPGEEASVMVRPERMHLCAPGAGQYEYAIRGEIGRVVYAGHSRKVTVNLADGGSAQVHEASGSDTHFKIGDAVDVCWSSDESCTIIGTEPPPATGALPTLRVG